MYRLEVLSSETSVSSKTIGSSLTQLVSFQSHWYNQILMLRSFLKADIRVITLTFYMYFVMVGSFDVSKIISLVPLENEVSIYDLVQFFSYRLTTSIVYDVFMSCYFLVTYYIRTCIDIRLSLIQFCGMRLFPFYWLRFFIWCSMYETLWSKSIGYKTIVQTMKFYSNRSSFVQFFIFEFRIETFNV